MEQWKDVINSMGRYQVSDAGRVRGPSGRILKPAPNNKGYPSVYIYYIPKAKARGKTRTIHRLVAEAFIDNPSDMPQVNHINGDKTDNRVSNLEWCSAKHNINHAVGLGLLDAVGQSNGRAKLTDRDVREIRSRLRLGHSCARICESYPVSRYIISQIKNNKLWTHASAYPDSEQ